MSGTLLFHSLWVGVGATILAMGFGFLAALAVWGLPPFGQKLAAIIPLTNALLPPFLLANAWLGWMASWRATQSPEFLEWTNLPLTAAALGGLLWPIPSLVFFQALDRIPAVQFEIEPGLVRWPLIRWLVWPAVRPVFQSVAPLLLVLALANFTIPTLFQVRVFTEAFWVRFNTRLDPWDALSVAWPLIVLPLLWLFLPQPRFFRSSRSVRAAEASMVRRRLGGWLVGAAGLMTGWLGLVLVGPLTSLLLARRTWSELPGAASAGLSAWLQSLSTSLIPASAVVLLALVVVGLQRQPRGPQLAWLLFLVPGVFLGVVAIELFNRPGLFAFYQSSGIQWLMLSLRYGPIGWAVVAAFSDPMGGVYSDAARLAGAGPWARWRVSRLPLVWRPAIAVWFIIVCLCLWDVESVVLVQPPGGETLALRIFNLLHYGHANQVNALAIVLLATALGIGGALLLLVAWLGPRRPRQNGVSLRSAVALPLAIAGLGLVASGCRPADGVETSRLKSSVFSAVQVIGNRGTAPGQFNKPRSLVCDRQDNLYVVDMTGRVQKFSPSGQWLLQWQMPETDLGKPKGMGLDPDGNILVVEPHYQRINHFNTNGQLVAQWGRKGTAPSEFILPRSIAVTSRGEYLISEYTVVDRIQRFTVTLPHLDTSVALPQGRPSPVVPYQFQGFWGEPGLNPGQFNRAEGLGIDGQDRLYVADSCNHRIQIFRSDGRFIRTYGHAGRSPGEFSYPYDIKVDELGRQYVCEFGNSRISIFDAHDQLIETLGGNSAGVAPGEFANPWSITLNSAGDLYVADSQNHRVQKFLRRRGGALASANVGSLLTPISVAGFPPATP